MSKTKISVFVDHDMMIRNFINTGALAELDEVYDVEYVFPSHKRVTVDIDKLPLKRSRMHPIDDRRCNLLSRLQHVAVVRKFRRRGDEVGRTLLEFYRSAWGAKWYYICSCLAYFPMWPLYQWHIRYKAGRDEWLMDYIKERNPEVLVYPTVLVGLYVSDIPTHAQCMQKKSLFLMNSWDNPSIKAMASKHPDLLAVWGEQSREDAVNILGMKPESVAICGAAQFEVYKKIPQSSRESFLEKNGLDPRKKTFLYAGSSKGLDEMNHLKKIENAILSRGLEDWQVLYRPHPWKCFASGEANFFDCEWIRTKMDSVCVGLYQKGFRNERFSVSESDYNHAHTTLSSVDCVMSPLSSFLLEAAMHGKPICAYSDDEEGASKQFRIATRHMLHFKAFFEKLDAMVCASSGCLEQTAADLIKRTDSDLQWGHQLQKQSEYFVEPGQMSYASRVISEIEKLLNART